MYSYLGPITIIALILLTFIAFLTNILYLKPIADDSNSDILKKFNSFPDIVFLFTKIGINLIFTLDKGVPGEHWAIFFFLILFSGTNAYYTIFFQNRINKSLILLNQFLSLLLLYTFFSLFIGSIIIKFFDFNGSLYLFLIGILIIFIFLLFQKIKNINFLQIHYSNINTPDEFYIYVSKLYNIFINKNKSRDYDLILESLIKNFEERCTNPNCLLKQYLKNSKKGIFSQYLLVKYCNELYKYGISKFKDNNLKLNYIYFLVTKMNKTKKALILLNSIENKGIFFLLNYKIYLCRKIIDKY